MTKTMNDNDDITLGLSEETCELLGVLYDVVLANGYGTKYWAPLIAQALHDVEAECPDEIVRFREEIARLTEIAEGMAEEAKVEAKAPKAKAKAPSRQSTEVEA